MKRYDSRRPCIQKQSNSRMVGELEKQLESSEAHVADLLYSLRQRCSELDTLRQEVSIPYHVYTNNNYASCSDCFNYYTQIATLHTRQHNSNSASRQTEQVWLPIYHTVQ